MDKDNTSPRKGKVKIQEVKFNLKSIKDENKPTLISAVFRYKNQKLVYSTRHKIPPKHWNDKKQLPSQTYTFYSDLKKDLDYITDSIQNVYKSYLENGQVDDLNLQTFKNELDILLKRVELPQGTKKMDLIDYVSKHIEEIKNNEDFNYRTAQKYQTLINNLTTFKPGTIQFEDINHTFWSDYKKWRYENTKTKSQNTLNKDMACLKSIMRKAHEENLHSNDIYKHKKFVTKVIKTSVFALTENEVNKLYQWDFSNNKRLARVRDWFVISCWTALRWSDFSTLKPEHIIHVGEDFYLRKDTIKTDEEVYIPVSSTLYELLKNYDFKSIDISSQKFNLYLKEVLEVVGITDNIMLKENERGVPVEKVYRKCDIVSAHCGRRTWATINFLKGFPIGLLMQVTGHTVESTFLSYVGASKLDQAIRLRELMEKQTN